LNGITAPSTLLGNDGDFYINTATNMIYGPKSFGIWPIGVSIVGPQGIQGVAGTNGTNGVTALVKTTAEAVGVNCTYGGTKVETGLDANNNGILDSGEINGSQTTYVCNGAGAGGGSVQFSNMQVYSTPGTYSWTCPIGVNKIMVELWGGGAGASSSGRQGGGYGKSLISVSPNTTYSLIVGNGGAMGQLCGGSVQAWKGGNSSFDNIFAHGGNGMGGACCGWGNCNVNDGLSNATFNIGGGGGIGAEGGQSFGGNNAPSGSNGRFPGGGAGSGAAGANGMVVIYY
jgi:collagen type I/II/III/V/XI/XXIV/XXVII alpha